MRGCFAKFKKLNGVDLSMDDFGYGPARVELTPIDRQFIAMEVMRGIKARDDDIAYRAEQEKAKGRAALSIYRHRVTNNIPGNEKFDFYLGTCANELGQHIARRQKGNPDQMRNRIALDDNAENAYRHERQRAVESLLRECVQQANACGIEISGGQLESLVMYLVDDIMCMPELPADFIRSKKEEGAADRRQQTRIEELQAELGRERNKGILARLFGG